MRWVWGVLGSSLVLAGCVAAQELFGRAEDVVPDEVDRIYARGLSFLQRQLLSGRMERDPYATQPGVVGLAVVAMLARGEDPNSGPYSAAIRRGLEMIYQNTNPANGYIGGSMYNHGFATLALAEAYGAVDDPRLGPTLRRAVDLILQSQARNPRGAWRYSPESTDADTTVSGAQLVALLAARNAGLAVPDEAIRKGLQFFTQCRTPEGGIGYTDARGPNNVRSAIGVLVFALAREKNSPTYQAALAFLAQDPYREHGYPFYYHYYAAQALFHADLELWRAWNQRMVQYFGAAQNPDGSWDGAHGQMFSTAATLLTLALNYRLLPIYER